MGKKRKHPSEKRKLSASEQKLKAAIQQLHANEKQLREEREKAQKYLDVAGTMMVVIDPDQKVTLINKRGCEILGYKEEEVLGRNWFNNFLPMRVRKDESAVFKQLMAGEIEPVEYEESLVLTRSGQERIIAWHNAVLTDEDGNIVDVLISGADITESERMKEALRESEEKYRKLTESSLTGIFINQDGKYVFVNHRFAKIHGFTPEESVGMEYMSLIHPEERKRVAEIVSKRLAGKDVARRYETRRLKKDGQAIWCEVMACCAEYMGKPAIMGNIVDITRRKQAEEQLKAANQQLEADAQQLEAANQQLRANEQQLKATNQQLQASEQQLKAANQQLQASEQQLKATNQQLRASEQQLKASNQQLRAGGQQLRATNQQLRANEQKLLDDQVQLKSLASELTLAEESERHRIATELHATISQSLVVSKLQLDTLRASVPSRDIARTLEEVCNLLDQTIQETKSLTFNLSSPILYELGFETAVSEWLTERIQKKH
ncbi:MAG: PAS domain S-box protein, partial [Planctomycetota bacterium]